MIDRNAMKALRRDIDAAMKAVGEKHNLDIVTGSGKFSALNASFQLKIATLSTTAEGKVVPVSQGRQALMMYYPAFVDKTVTLYNGKQGKVVEYHSRKPKFPFIVEVGNGKLFKVPESLVASQLGKA